MTVHKPPIDIARRYNQRFRTLFLAILFCGNVTGTASAADDPWANASDLRWRVLGVAFADKDSVVATFEYYDFRLYGPANRHFSEETIATVNGIIDRQTGLLRPFFVLCRQKISSAAMSRDRGAMAFGVRTIAAAPDNASGSSHQSPPGKNEAKGKFGIMIERGSEPAVMLTTNSNRSLKPAGLSENVLWYVAHSGPTQALIRYDLATCQSSVFDLGVFGVIGIQNVSTGKFLLSSVGLRNPAIIYHIAQRMNLDPREIALCVLIYEFDAAKSKLTLLHISDYLGQDNGFGPITEFGSAHQIDDGTIFVTARHSEKPPYRYALYRYRNGNLDPIGEIPGLPGKMTVSDDGEWVAFGHSAPIGSAGRIEVVEGVTFFDVKSHQFTTYDLGKDRYLEPAKKSCPQ